MNMRKEILILAAAVGVLTACNTDIKSVKDNPDKFINKQITVQGHVSKATNLLVVKFYEVTDKTGSLYVVTKGDLPEKDQQITVKGTVEKPALDELKFDGVVLKETEKKVN